MLLSELTKRFSILENVVKGYKDCGYRELHTTFFNLFWVQVVLLHRENGNRLLIELTNSKICTYKNLKLVKSQSLPLALIDLK